MLLYCPAAKVLTHVLAVTASWSGGGGDAISVLANYHGHLRTIRFSFSFSLFVFHVPFAAETTHTFFFTGKGEKEQKISRNYFKNLSCGFIFFLLYNDYVYFLVLQKLFAFSKIFKLRKKNNVQFQEKGSIKNKQIYIHRRKTMFTQTFASSNYVKYNTKENLETPKNTNHFHTGENSIIK